MQRLPDWRSRLHVTIAGVETQPFEYGKNDCALFGASIVFALTGTDPAEAFRGRYKTKLGGVRAIRKAGFKDQLDFLEKTFAEIHPAFAQVGDLGLVDTADGPAVVAILGPLAAGVGPEGLTRFEVSKITKAFRVGAQ